MTMHDLLTIRYDAETTDPRLDVLLPLVQADPSYRGMKMNRSVLVRMLLATGLDVMEQLYLGEKRG